MPIRIRKIKDQATWLKWRRANINGSECGAVMGVNPYKTPLALYHDKNGTLPPETDPLAIKRMERGDWLEPAVLKAARRKHPDWEITEPNSYYDDPRLRMGCTPDALVRSKRGFGVLQAKTVSEEAFRSDTWWLENLLTPPIDYQLQTLDEAKFTGADHAILAVLIVNKNGTVDYDDFEVEINNDAWAALVEAVRKFWADFDKGIAPKVIPAYDGETVKLLYPSAVPGSTIDLSGDNELPGLIARDNELSAELSEMRKPLKPLEEERDGIRTQIKAKIGGYELAYAGPWQLTFKQFHRNAYDYRQLNIKAATVGESPKRKAMV